MNRSRFRKTLSPCPRCRLDSGLRMQTETVPEQFYVVCQSCGYRAGPCADQGRATRAWEEAYEKVSNL